MDLVYYVAVPDLSSSFKRRLISLWQTGCFYETALQLRVTLTVSGLRARRPWGFLDTPGGGDKDLKLMEPLSSN